MIVAPIHIGNPRPIRSCFRDELRDLVNFRGAHRVCEFHFHEKTIQFAFATFIKYFLPVLLAYLGTVLQTFDADVQVALIRTELYPVIC